MIFDKPFDQIDQNSLQALIDSSVRESVHIDFKRQSYGTDDASKKELLKDVSAFANTLGGHILIGMDEDSGAASAITPLSGNVDQELRRLESIVKTGIEPAIIGLRMRRVEANGGDIIAIHIPRSPNPPHRVIVTRSNRFYMRNSAGCFEPSVEELRSLFGAQHHRKNRPTSLLASAF